MAKSLRSKWKRKMRAIKRERYGEKELKRLNDMLIKAGDIQFLPEIKEEKMEEEHPERDPILLKSSSRLSRYDKSNSGIISETNEIDLTKEKDVTEKIVVDGERIFTRRKMRDQFGQYPDWMNKRKIRTQQKKNKRLQKRAKSLKRK